MLHALTNVTCASAQAPSVNWRLNRRISLQAAARDLTFCLRQTSWPQSDLALHAANELEFGGGVKGRGRE
jgi:hypothetical protein